MKTDICQWKGNTPCTEQATRDLVPQYGPPSRMCETHYGWLKFLEGSPESKSEDKKCQV